MVEWDNIRILKNIGEVYLVETIDIDAAELETNDTRILVAIKTLKKDYTAI